MKPADLYPQMVITFGALTWPIEASVSRSVMAGAVMTMKVVDDVLTYSVDLGPSELPAPIPDSDRRAEARAMGYEGSACPECANFTMVRNGTCLKCNTCGSTTGCS